MAKKNSRSKNGDAPPAAPPIGLVFADCSVETFEISNPDPAEISGIHYAITVRRSINAATGATSTLIISVEISWEGHKKSKSGMLASITTNSKYQIHGLKESGGNIEIPGWIAATMTSASVGTTRGLLLSKLANTPFANLILPLFDLHSLLPSEITNNVANHGV
ncbi:MAG: hypothetical protein IPM61_13460 [Chlorobi bacterium]|nr:MAG: hypothetical protein UZ07_CHB004003045 [Chlorobi bacterium OLB7]MBK8912323.1 hypothetical protein [Chlorobiota bacterium]